MKKLLLTSVFLCAIYIFANAQQRKAVPYYTDEFMTELGLSADQMTKVRTLKKGADAKSIAVKRDKSLSAEARKAKLKVVIGDRSREYFNILTKEQREKVRAIEKEVKEYNARLTK